MIVNYFSNLFNLRSIKFLLSFLVQALVFNWTIAQELKLSSPNEQLEIGIDLSEKVSWNVKLNGTNIIEKAIISMDLDNSRIIDNSPKLRSKNIEGKT